VLGSASHANGVNPSLRVMRGVHIMALRSISKALSTQGSAIKNSPAYFVF
jgi:hypothetical protein